MLAPDPMLQKSVQVRNIRLGLDESYCMSRSPFTVAANPDVTLQRLDAFSEDIREAMKGVLSLAGKTPESEEDRPKSIKVIADRYGKEKDFNVLEGQLNRVFLHSADMVQKGLRELEIDIAQTRKISPDKVAMAATRLNNLGLLIEAVPEIYQRVL